ncbi:hypothetical protein LBMAG42_10130 [Deltaproteobacteria bacterium]|nr:hypothetical protein LBMAG42_10130 [Deltaproteobacteria bacterium]
MGRDLRTLALRAVLLGSFAALPCTAVAVTVGNVSGVLLLLLLGALSIPAPFRAFPLTVSFLLKPYGLPLVLGQRWRSAALPLLAVTILANGGLFGNNDASAMVSALIALGPPFAAAYLVWAAPIPISRVE